MIAGAGYRARTDDLLITNQLLYQLSYAGKKNARTLARARRSNKLSIHSTALTTGPYGRDRDVTESGSAVSRVLITVLK